MPIEPEKRRKQWPGGANQARKDAMEGIEGARKKLKQLVDENYRNSHKVEVNVALALVDLTEALSALKNVNINGDSD